MFFQIDRPILTFYEYINLDSKKTAIFKRKPLINRLKSCIRPFGSFHHMHHSARCLSLEGAFKLWEEYTSEAEMVFARYAGDKISFHYEDFLEHPIDNIQLLAEFSECRSKIAPGKVKEIEKLINKKRVNAFLNDRILVDFYNEKRVTRLMSELGYNDILKNDRSCSEEFGMI